MTIQSVGRAIQILFSFTVEEPLLGVSELSAKLGINQSTVHHLIQSLMAEGLIEQDAFSRRYYLGLRTIELGGTMLRSRNLSVEIQPFLHHVADQLEETTYLGMLVGGGLLNMEQVCGPHLIQHVGWQGRRTPFYCTSAGKVLAASLASDELEYLLHTQELTGFTQRTISTREELLEELACVRDQGYALNIGELDNHHHAVAVPIKWRGGDQVVAALGVVGPAFRFSEARCLEAVPFLTSVAQEISSRLSSTIFAPQAIQRDLQPDRLKA